MSNQKKLFGTDGVRGVANREPMMVETAVNLARAVAHVLKERKGAASARFGGEGYAFERVYD